MSLFNLKYTRREESGGDGGDGGGGGDGDGGGTTSWLASLPEVLREAPFIGKAENAEAALVAINNAAQWKGNSIRIPSDDASVEDLSAFNVRLMEKVPSLMVKPDMENAEAMEAVYKQMGRPQEAGGYKYAAPEGRDSPSDIEAIMGMAHKHGLSQKQFEGFVGDILNTEYQNIDDAATAQKAENTALETAWGAAHGQNSKIVANFLANMKAPESIVNAAAEGKMKSDEMEWVLSLAKATASPGQLESQEGANMDPNVLPPSEAKDRIQEMLNNRDHAYWKATDPRHKEAVNRMLALQAMSNPALKADYKRVGIFQ